MNRSTAPRYQADDVAVAADSSATEEAFALAEGNAVHDLLRYLETEIAPTEDRAVESGSFRNTVAARVIAIACLGVLSWLPIAALLAYFLT